MATDQNNLPITTFRRRKIHLRRRKVPYVRLGGKKKARVGVLVVRIWRRMRSIRWVKLKYICMLKKLKQYYCKMMKEMIEASASLESFQQRVLMEASFAVPVMGVSFSNNIPGSTFM